MPLHFDLVSHKKAVNKKCIHFLLRRTFVGLLILMAMAPTQQVKMPPCTVMALLTLTLTTKIGGQCQNHVQGSTCSSLNMACLDGEQAHILDAYFFAVDDWLTTSICNANCSTTSQADSPQQCFVSQGRCRQRLSLTDLNTVYNLCDVSPTDCSLRSFRARELSIPTGFFAEYVCVKQEGTINPCVNQNITQTETSFMLHPGAESCHSECIISPVQEYSGIDFKYNFLLRAMQFADDNYVMYMFTIRKPSEIYNTTWRRLQSSYYDSGFRRVGVNDLWIKFNISNVKHVRRLLISLNDLEVKIRCHARSTPSSGKPPAPDSRNRPNTTHIGLVVVAVAVVVCTVFASIVVWKRRCHARIGNGMRYSQRPLPSLPNEATLNRRPPPLSDYFPVDDQIYSPYAIMDDSQDNIGQLLTQKFTKRSFSLPDTRLCPAVAHQKQRSASLPDNSFCPAPPLNATETAASLSDDYLQPVDSLLRRFVPGPCESLHFSREARHNTKTSAGPLHKRYSLQNNYSHPSVRNVLRSNYQSDLFPTSTAAPVFLSRSLPSERRHLAAVPVPMSMTESGAISESDLGARRVPNDYLDLIPHVPAYTFSDDYLYPSATPSEVHHLLPVSSPSERSAKLSASTKAGSSSLKRNK